MFNNYINDIIVYIPKNYDKTIEIDLDYGNVNVVDLENATINIKEDCGNIILGKIKNVMENKIRKQWSARIGEYMKQKNQARRKRKR